MLTTGWVFASNTETEAVIRKLQWNKTAAQRVMEYYGLRKEDLVKAKKLKEMGIKHTPRLAELGVSKEAFEKLFEDILDFDNGNTEQGAGESVGSGADGSAADSGVANTPVATKGRKGRPGK